MTLEKYRYIVVEGPIGVGKTSLAQRLAAHIGADTLLEKPQENPFLALFYQDPQRHAMATQLFFLFQRINEVRYPITCLIRMRCSHAST
jgi:deoxyadenosine/deoxycytidine kinase